jgi:hypothetical protein
MSISRKKKAEFEKILFLKDNNNFYLDIISFRKLFDSDFLIFFYEFLDEKINEVLKNCSEFYFHICIESLSLSDMYSYDKILNFAKILHKYTEFLPKIYLYGSSGFMSKFVLMISSSLNFDINKKLIFMEGNKYSILFQEKNEI